MSHIFTGIVFHSYPLEQVILRGISVINQAETHMIYLDVNLE